MANRVNYILGVSKKFQWFHVPTDANPADLASRGCLPSKLSTGSMWVNGPDFLWLDESKWMSPPEVLRVDDDKLELKREKYKGEHVNYVKFQSKSVDSLTDRFISKFSDWVRFRRAIAIFTQCCKCGLKFRGPLQVDELLDAERGICAYAQRSLKTEMKSDKFARLFPIEKDG